MGIPYAEVIGDPVEHSKSPLIHKFWLAKLGLPYEFLHTVVKAQGLSTFIERRRIDPMWCGCSVTMPLKVNVIEHLDQSSPQARAIGAVNCITRIGANVPELVGHNTDWLGFMEPLRPWLALKATFQIAHVIGAGGAAAAVSYGLDRAGFTIISIARDTAKALALRQQLDLFDDDLVKALSDFARGPAKELNRHDRIDLLVNATPLGMAGFPPLEVDLAGLPPDLVVYDLVYHPLHTDLLRQAREQQMPAIDGLSMLIGQAAKAFELFFDEVAPREYDAELRELLTR